MRHTVIRAVLVGLVASSAGLTLEAMPAQAATGAIVVNGDQPLSVPYDDCVSVPYSWQAQDDSGQAVYFEADATLSSPEGTPWDSDFVGGDNPTPPDPVTRDGDFTLCWGDGEGRYQVDLLVTFYDVDFNEVDSGQFSTTLSVTEDPKPARKRTRTKLRASDRSPHFNERVTFTIRSKVRRHGEWRAHRHAEALVGIRCRNLRNGADTGWLLFAEGELNRRGRGYVQVRWDVRRNIRCRFFAGVYRTPTTKASTSRVVTVRTGRSPRARSALSLGAGVLGRELAPFSGLTERLAPASLIDPSQLRQ